MPELPEVETIKRGLEKRVKGLQIRDIDSRVEKLFHGRASDARSAKVEKIWRRAKVLGIDLSNGFSILIHLKMTGQLVFCGADEKEKMVGGHPQKSYNEPLPHKHTHIIIYFSDGSRLFFNDLRKFGWMKIVPTGKIQSEHFIVSLGLEPLGVGLKNEKEKIKLRIKHSRLAIKTFLLDQKYIAGIGNIYSDEILYRAGVMPDRQGVQLGEEEIERILKAITKVLEGAVKYGGSSDSTFVGVDGERGNFLKVAAVYHKEKDPRGHDVQKKKIGGRTAHFCTICQK